MRAATAPISGVGIAGLTLAFWLIAVEFTTRLVEQAPGLPKAAMSSIFCGLGYDIAERMRLANELRRVGYSMREMWIEDRRGELCSRPGARQPRITVSQFEI